MKTLIHIPHASVFLPSAFIDTFDRKKLPHETEVMTDWFCDELFDCGREMLIFPVSRLICDVERFRDDEEEIMSQIGMGAVYTSCSDLSPLRQINHEQKDFILRTYYDRHHRLLTDAVSSALGKHGSCLIIDAHSFFPSPLPYELNQSSDRPDFCIGTSDFHTPEAITNSLRSVLERRGFSVKLNSPFYGTMVPLKYYLTDKRITSVMIEVNRGLYMSSPGVKNQHFLTIKSILKECVEAAEEIVSC